MDSAPPCANFGTRTVSWSSRGAGVSAETQAAALRREAAELRERAETLEASALAERPGTELGTILQVGTPLELVPRWVEYIDKAKTRVWLTACTFDLAGGFAPIQDALIRARRRGVDV